MKCPKCGSDKLIKHGKQWRLDKDEPYRIQRYRCNNCGRFTLHPVDDSKKVKHDNER